MFKRFLAAALILALLVPALPVHKAEALSTSNYTAEPYNLMQSKDAVLSPPSSPATSYNSITAGFGYGSMSNMQSVSDNASWAYAALAVLKAAADKKNMTDKEFSLLSLANATSNKSAGSSGGFNRDATGAGNRSMLTAYLMRGTNGGPIPGQDSFGMSAGPLAKEKPAQLVSGVVYIPNIGTTASDIEKGVYQNRLKNAIVQSGAVGASLYFDDSRFYQDYTDDTSWIYDNATRRDSVTNAIIVSALNRADDHTVALIGWDDYKKVSYTVEKIIGDTATQTSVEVTGAFLAYDSINLRGDPYWISYATVLSNAYCIEGFYTSALETSGAGDFVPTQEPYYPSGSAKPDKNPLAVTYEHDLYGMTGVRAVSGGGNTAYYANVFDVRDNAAAIHAVSVFLTGENSTVDVYLIDNYKNTESLNLNDPAVSAKARLIATATKALPGYYTIPVTEGGVKTAIVKSKRFAIVAVVTSSDASIPLQSTSLATTRSGQSFFSSNGTSWTDAFSQSQSTICIKAHAEKDIEVELESLEIRDADGVAANLTTVPLLIAPGASQAVGPTLVPNNATDVIHSETVWEAKMPYYKRDKDSGFIDAKYNDVTEKWEAEMVEGEWLVWSASWGMFVPKATSPNPYPETRPGSLTNAKLNRTQDKDDNYKEYAVDGYAEPVLSLVNPFTGATTLRVSKEQVYFEKDYGLELRVTVTTGKKDEAGKFKTLPGHTASSPKYDIKGSIASDAVAVKIDAIDVATLEINRADYTLKAGGSVSLTVKQLDVDGKATPATRTVTWYILDENGNEYSEAYDPRDPYKDGAPIAVVDKNGKVTALRDGFCRVYAEVEGELDTGTGKRVKVTSDPCRITVTKSATSGISINKKKMTMSNGAKLTLTASVKPASASNKGVDWTVEAQTQKYPTGTGDVLRIDPITGIIEALNPGTAKVVVTSREGGYRAECLITVTEGPSATIRKGKTASYSVLGAGSKDTVEWYFEYAGAGGTETGTAVPDPANTSRNIVSGSKSGTKFKVSAQNIGPAKLVGKVTVKLSEPIEVEPGVFEDKITVREQTWNLESVVAISKMAFKNDKNEIVKKLTLCVKPDGTGGQSVTLSVDKLKPADATMLDFAWTTKLNKQKEPMVSISNGGGEEIAVSKADETITVTALKPGSTKITGVNYNGNKKVSLSIKIMLYPTSDQITVKKSSVTVYVGKTANVKGKVTGKNVNKELTYSLAPGSEAYVSLEVKKGKTTGKLSAKAVGEATVIITGAGGASTTVTVSVTEKTKK